MDAEQFKSVYALSTAVRSLFHVLGDAISTLHKSTGITAGMRGVLESVISGGPQTVPQMARARPVSRQHIQCLVNDLLWLKLVEYADNPAHRRSKVVRATQEGGRLFARLRKGEVEAFGQLSLDLTSEELDSATGVLTGLSDAVLGAGWQAILDDYSKQTEGADA